MTLVSIASASGLQAVEAGETLGKLGFPPGAAAQLQEGEFLETSLRSASERDLSLAIAFRVKEPPREVTQKLREELLLERVDPNTIAYGRLEGEGTAAQLAGLGLTPAQVEAYAEAKPGDALNLSSDEIEGLAGGGRNAAALQARVHDQLLTRYRAYRAGGLSGMAPYARSGSERDPAGDLRAATLLVRQAGILPGVFYDLLDGYPKEAPSDLAEVFYWSQFKAHGSDTIALVHAMFGTFSGTPVAVQRHYYVSTGYDAEQAIAGFLPDGTGTLVIYTNHTSTDQLAGLGSGAKRSIGRKLMAGQLEALFRKASAELAE